MTCTAATLCALLKSAIAPPHQRVALRPVHVDLLGRGTPLYVHTVCTRPGYHPDPKQHQSAGMNWDNVFGTIGPLTRMMAPYRTAKNLLEAMAAEVCGIDTFWLLLCRLSALSIELSDCALVCNVCRSVLVR